MERRTYAVSDIVIATNETYRRRAIDEGGLPADKVFVVRNGPPLSYQPLPPPAELSGRAPFIIGYVGTIGTQDGLDYWLRAIKHLVTTFDRRDFLAVIIGDGDAMPDLRVLARELQVEEFVMFTGRLPELDARRYLSGAALCVQPDPSGPLNDHCTMNKLMEYMALGKATVAFDLPETRFSGGEATVYVANNDEREFAHQVDRLLGDPHERSRRGEIGRQRVASALAWEYSVAPLVQAYVQGLGLEPDIRATLASPGEEAQQP